MPTYNSFKKRKYYCWKNWSKDNVYTSEREKNFTQFKHDVESEVDLRLKHVKLEKEAL